MSLHSKDIETKSALDDHHVENALNTTTFTAREQKSIVRRIDIRLVLTLGCLYCISLMDRTNLGAASVAG